MKRFNLSVLICLQAITLSCVSNEVLQTMTDAEACLDDRPDRALALTGSIDTTALRTRAARAEYALLHAIALDKNYIDTTDTRVIRPAVDYYEKHGTPDEKMKSIFYLGKIYMNAGENEKAIVSFSKAREYFGVSNDKRQQGLICGALADLYRVYHLSDAQLAALKQALACFSSAGDTARYNLTLGRLAIAYQDLHEWSKADSLYREALVKNASDPFAMRITLSNYAIMKMVLPDPDFQGAIGLFERLTDEYKVKLPASEATCYAFARESAGDHSACDRILSGIEEKDEYWMYRIRQARMDYKEAIAFLNETYVIQDSLIKDMLGNSLSKALNDHYAGEASAALQKVRIGKLHLLIAILASILVIIGLFLFAGRRIRKEREEKLRMSRLMEEADAVLRESSARRDHDLANLRDAFAKLYSEQFSSLKSLCTLYLSIKPLSSRKDRIYAEVESIISFINSDEETWKIFEHRIDRALDNIVLKLRSEMDGLSETDVRLFCYSIIKLDGETISSITGLTPSNIYTRKFRLKERILAENPGHKDEFLLFF